MAKRYWYSHDESDSLWISEELDLDDPSCNDGCVVQHREAREDEVDDEAGKEAFQKEREEEYWKNRQSLDWKDFGNSNSKS